MDTNTVVFDIGGVLVADGNRMANLQGFVADNLGEYDRDAFRSAYWNYRDSYDLGCSDGEFWGPVLAECGIRATPGEIRAIAVEDGRLNATIDERSAGLVESLHDAGVRLYVLSNAPAPMADAVRKAPWFALFQGGVFSCDVGDHKPNETAYRTVAELAAGQGGARDFAPVFFDDRAVNVEAARAVGWRAVRWRSVEEAREYLSGAGLLPG